MACCAFAVFLLLNLLAPLGWLRRLRGAGERHNAAVAWRYGQATAARPAPARVPWRRAMAGAVAVEVLAVAAFGAYLLSSGGPSATSAGADWDALVALHTSWCRSDEVRANSILTLAEQTP